MSVRSPSSVIVGIDLSLTSTGLARLSLDDGSWTTATLRVRPKMKGHERLDLILETVLDWASNPQTDLVVLEGPSYGSQSSSYHQLAGLWWLVRHGLHRVGAAVAVVAPQARAKYATGKGNAAKDDVLAAVIRRYGIPLEVDISGNDVADALAMAAMGARHLGVPIEERIPEVNAGALDKVDWPQ